MFKKQKKSYLNILMQKKFVYSYNFLVKNNILFLIIGEG